MVTRKGEMADKKVICPECGKKLSWRGLHGHLRFEHGLDSDSATVIMARIEPFRDLTVEERLEVLVQRIEDLVADDEAECVEDEPDGSGWF
jgi:hypothetical protein